MNINSTVIVSTEKIWSELHMYDYKYVQECDME